MNITQEYDAYYYQSSMVLDQDALASNDLAYQHSPEHEYDFDDAGVVPEGSFISPISYDPITGIYTQTYRAEHSEFLRLYGQHLEIPDDCGQSSSGAHWTYNDVKVDHAPQPKVLNEPSTGFHYDSGSYWPPAEPSHPSPEDVHMLQYLASPPADHACPPYSDNARASTSSLADNVTYKHSRRHHDVVEEEIVQPHMIVPSQRNLGPYLQPMEPRYAPTPIVSPLTHTPPVVGSLMSHLPVRDVRSPSPRVPAFPAALSEPHASGETAGYVSHQHYSHAAYNDGASSSAATSPTSDVTLREHSHPHSPRASHRRLSRSWSPSGRSSKSRSPSVTMRGTPPPLLKIVDTERKPLLACLFCRARKIACGPPLPGSGETSCNQCARRHLHCEYPTESRRGMRRRAPKTPAEKAAARAAKAPRKRTVR